MVKTYQVGRQIMDHGPHSHEPNVAVSPMLNSNHLSKWATYESFSTLRADLWLGTLAANGYMNFGVLT